MTRVLIIEDEKPAADFLEHQLRQISADIDILAKLATVRDAVEWLSVNKADLIFMDIHLADGNCFSIFDQVEVKTPVIFTTAYDQYAIKAFKVNSIDYLLKPIDESDLRKSLAKYQDIKSLQQNDFTGLAELLRSVGKKPQYQQRFLVYSGEKIKAVKTNEIAFFYISEKEVFMTTFENRSYGLDFSLDKLETVLDPDDFFRINRKLLIRLEAIETMYNLSGNRIKIKLKPASTEEAIVSFHRVSAFKKWLNR